MLHIIVYMAKQAILIWNFKLHVKKKQSNIKIRFRYIIIAMNISTPLRRHYVWLSKPRMLIIILRPII